MQVLGFFFYCPMLVRRLSLLLHPGHSTSLSALAKTAGWGLWRPTF